MRTVSAWKPMTNHLHVFIGESVAQKKWHHSSIMDLHVPLLYVLSLITLDTSVEQGN